MNLFKKFFNLLSNGHKKMCIIFVFLLLAGMFFETLGVGLVVPLIILITEPSFFEQYPIISEIILFFSPLNWFSIESKINSNQFQLITGGMILATIFYFIKNTFLTFLTWLKFKFVNNIDIYWTQKIFKGYLQQPYIFHVNNNSAFLIRDINQCRVASRGVEIGVELISEILVLIGITTLLLVIERTGSLLIILFLGLSSFGYYYFSKKHLFNWGKEGQYLHGKILQLMQQSFGGIKDIKILGKEKVFSNQLILSKKDENDLIVKNSILRAIPKLWLEFLLLVSLLGLIFTMLLNNITIETLIPTLGLFAAAAFRTMPSINRILGNSQVLRHNLHAMNNVYNNLSKLSKTTEEINQTKVKFEKNIKLKNVGFKYSNNDDIALKNTNIEISFGEVVGIIGGSGAGKSTLLDIILGLLEPQNGEITVDNFNIKENIRGWQDQIGYVPQNVYFLDDSIKNNIALGLEKEKIDENQVMKALKSAQIYDYVSGLPQGINTTIKEHGARLSGGQRQRIGIARALYRNPSVLVLDEATNALDEETEKGIVNSITKLKGLKTVIIVTHRISTVRNCDKIYKLNDGKLVNEGKFDEVVKY
tara:strand:+ start:1177 stop:2949 length:1773 start_codon:yes stop_codon:yes gene_type:complete